MHKHLTKAIVVFDGGDNYEDLNGLHGEPQVVVINKNTTWNDSDGEGVSSWDDALMYDYPVRFIRESWVISVSDLLDFYLRARGLDIKEL
jgi:hypothetical protein